jgi:hypothetical protein
VEGVVLVRVVVVVVVDRGLTDVISLKRKRETENDKKNNIEAISTCIKGCYGICSIYHKI